MPLRLGPGFSEFWVHGLQQNLLNSTTRAAWLACLSTLVQARWPRAMSLTADLFFDNRGSLGGGWCVMPPPTSILVRVLTPQDSRVGLGGLGHISFKCAGGDSIDDILTCLCQKLAARYCARACFGLKASLPARIAGMVSILTHSHSHSHSFTPQSTRHIVLVLQGQLNRIK